MYASETGLARATVNGLVSCIGPVGKFCIPYGQGFDNCLSLGLADYLRQPYDKVLVSRDQLGNDFSFFWENADTTKLLGKVKQGLEKATEDRISNRNNLVRLMVSNSDERIGLDFHWFMHRGEVGRYTKEERRGFLETVREHYSKEERQQLKDIATCMIPHIRKSISTEDVCVI